MKATRKVTGWPAFAEAVTAGCRQLKVPPPHLGAWELADYPKPTRDFIEKKLIPSLPDGQRKALKNLEGEWPAYPRRLAELARQHKKPIPGITLPGPPALWEAARVGN
jgi:hypothetical protein